MDIFDALLLPSLADSTHKYIPRQLNLTIRTPLPSSARRPIQRRRDENPQRDQDVESCDEFDDLDLRRRGKHTD